ncbi:MAG: substrate-binding domain-containing protein [Acidobacteria bacterium]|nr:substrate-binding domain-containing protein [Acidobacteriota bacterium]
MRRCRLLALAFLFIVSLPGCGTGHSAEEKYFLITLNVQIPYWQTAKAGYSQAASDLKVWSEFSGPDSYDAKAEQQAFERALAQKATGILVAAADPELLKADIDQAIARGIPVLTIDSDAPSSKRLFLIGTNNYQAGFTGGQRLTKELHGKGNVVVFTMPDQINLKQRLQGYQDALQSAPGIKIIRVVDIKGDPRIAFDTASQILGKERDKVDGFVCLEALAGKEVATVLSNNGVTNKALMAMDTDPDTLDWIQKGVIRATISQKPYSMAYVGLMLLDHLYHHKLRSLDRDWSADSFAPIPSFIDTGSHLIDKGSVDRFAEAKKSAETRK